MSELQKIVEALRARPIPEKQTWSQRRAAMEEVMQGLALPRDVATTAVDASGVAAEWIDVPSSDRERVMLYLHGGGYTLGSIATHRHLVSRIARAAGSRALAIDYRLAPESPFPAAIEDAVTAYRFLLDGGTEPRHITIGGDSAGGGLTLATSVKLRELGLPQPAGAVLLSPWTDLTGSGDSITSRAAEDPMVTGEGLHMMAQAYMGAERTDHPLGSPLFADLADLAPMLVQVGSAEVLLDDSTRLAARAAAAGTSVELEIYEGMIHVFQAFPQLEESDTAIARLGEFSRRLGSVAA